MIDSLLAIFAPHSCSGCGNVGSILCDYCKNDIVSEPFARCMVCLQPTVHDDVCHPCKTSQGISAGWCVGVRESALKALLDQYKFNSARDAGTICVELLDITLPVLPTDLTIVPVPTVPSHVRVRGFDHTALIAKRLARRRNLPYARLLSRSSGDTQHFKTRAERLRTAADSLSVKSSPPSSVLLLDDIYTTGATLQACVQKLHKAGATDIYVAIIARQTLD